MKRSFPALVVLLLAAAVLAVVLSLPASAQLYQVTVRLTDGSLHTVVVDLPPGASLEDAVGHVEGEPVTIAPLDTSTSPNPNPTGTPKPPPPAASKPDPAVQPTPNKPATSGDVAKPQTPAEQPAKPKQKSKHKRPHRKPRGHRDKHKSQPEPKSSHPISGGNRAPIRRPDGAPTPSNPGFVDALPGPSTHKGVPNFVIRKFRVPPFLLPIYQAAGIQYGVRWEILAAINEIETDYGRNLNVSSAGALGWMQFMPSTWKTWGVDGNKDHKKDPYNPVDAIFAAARYLQAAGYAHDVRRSIFAYNHANWYVDSVMLRARLIAGVPADLIGSLTGLTEGRFPVYARARYADDLAEQKAQKRVKAGQNAAHVIQSNDERHGIDIFASRGAPAVAVNDGVIKKMGNSRRAGRYVVLQDVYGNRYMYAHLGTIARYYPVPKADAAASTGRPARALHASRESAPTAPASAGHQPAPADTQNDSTGSAPAKERLFAHPGVPGARENGGMDQLLDAKLRKDGGVSTFKNYFSRPFGLNSRDVRLRRLKVGSHVIGGTILGRIGLTEPGKAAHLYFEIRPAGRGAPRIDPKPILDGWKLLEATAIYRANGRNALRDAGHLTIGQILLMPQSQLERTVLHDPRIDIYPCGRQDIRAGSINRRVLATLEYLSSAGFKPTVSSLKCGHGFLTASGNVSEHSSGNAVDISAVNGIPILGHQEHGGITEQTVRALMRLQGTMRPHQIISLLDLGGNSMALADHYNHIHVGFYARYGSNGKAGLHALAVLKPGQWSDLMARLRRIDNPVVPTTPSRYAIPAHSHHRRGD